MLKAAGDMGVRLVTELLNAITREGSVSDDWLKSVIVKVYKGKGDTLDQGKVIIEVLNC